MKKFLLLMLGYSIIFLLLACRIREFKDEKNISHTSLNTHELETNPWQGSINKFLQQNHFENTDALVAAVAKYLTKVTIVYSSRAEEPSRVSKKLPRIFLSDERRENILAFYGKPRDDEKKSDTVQFIEFRKTGILDFGKVDFPDGKLSVNQDPNCYECHGGSLQELRQAHWISFEYPFWPGWLGSIHEPWQSPKKERR